MIIKPATGRSDDVATLDEILERTDLSERQRSSVELEMKKVRAGVKGELEAAHHIDGQYRSLNNFAVPHDLRIEHEGEVAQIDHIVINLGLQIFVCETKHFSSGLACNDQGEWVGFLNGKLRQVDVLLSQGRPVAEAVRAIAVTPFTYSLDAAALDEARDLGIDVSAVADDALRRAVVDARRRRWLDENAGEFAAQAKWHERNAHPLADILAAPAAASRKD